MRMKYEPNRYQVNYGDQYQQYRDKEWSIHSAECIASFFNSPQLCTTGHWYQHTLE